MSAKLEGLLIVDGPGEGARNMALDEALLEWLPEKADSRQTALLRRPVVRFYQWREPTLSLGYFQKHAERAGHAPSLSCPLVRRSSGGGAILHDRELTYSIVWPIEGRGDGRAAWLYDAAHDSLVETLAELGAAATRWPGAQTPAQTKSEPFLCFQRRAVGDVVVGQWKIAGSAQRRQRGAILQHGSVLLARSSWAPELGGLAEVAGITISPPEMGRAWGGRLSAKLGIALRECEWPAPAAAASSEILREKFGNRAWTEKR